MSWLLAAVLAQLVVAGAVYLDKIVIDHWSADPLGLSLVGGAVAGVTVSAIAVTQPVNLSGRGLLLSAGAGGLMVVYLIPYFAALRTEEASRVVPLFQLVPVFALLLAAATLKERLGPREWLGFIAVLAGAGLFQRGGRFGRSSTLAIYLMVLASFLAATADVMGKLARTDYWSLVGGMAAGSFACSALAAASPIGRRKLIQLGHQLRTAGWTIVIAANILDRLFQALLFFAIVHGRVALVSVTTGLEPLILVAYGLALSRLQPTLVVEASDRGTITAKLLAGAVVLGGVALIATG